MATWPSRIRRSAPRREVSPACARILFSLSFGMRRFARCDVLVSAGRSQVGQHELALDLRQVREVAEPERDEELLRRLVEERPARRFLASRHANESALEEIL